MTHYLEFWDSPNISGTVTARNFKFGAEMEGSEYKGKKTKLGQRGHLGSREPILGFWDPLISPELLKLETSNLAPRWMAVSTNEKIQN